MPWNPDAPIKMLDRASRVFWELCGPELYLNWLEKEVRRTRVHLDCKKAVVFYASTAGGARDPQQPISPLAAAGAASPIVEELVEVLRWYGDASNYIRKSCGGGSAPIAADCGQKAERLLAKYEAAN